MRSIEYQTGVNHCTKKSSLKLHFVTFPLELEVQLEDVPGTFFRNVFHLYTEKVVAKVVELTSSGTSSSCTPKRSWLR